MKVKEKEENKRDRERKSDMRTRCERGGEKEHEMEGKCLDRKKVLENY